MELSNNAKYILEQRYLQKDSAGNIIETPVKMFMRVAKTIAKVDYKYSKTKEFVTQEIKDFFNMMNNLEFLPNSPTLMNAGTSLGLLSACFVLPVNDDIDEIFKSIGYAAKIHKMGGGTGFSFSKIRPEGDYVSSTGGIASGPLSFMVVFDSATAVIKQGGKRRGANMGVMRIDHPDIEKFIDAKKDNEKFLSNFNLSVALTDEFIEAVNNDKDFHLVNPRTGKNGRMIKAKYLFNKLAETSWGKGEPAVIFIDTINKHNPTPKLGDIETTNPCGEVPLLPYESCNLGSINLSKFIKNKTIDWERLKVIIKLAVRFLDNVIDANKYPLYEIDQISKANRKIGLGLMGWADTLIELGIKYDTQEAITLAEKIMMFIQSIGFDTSKELGEEKGSFPNFNKSIFKGKIDTLRNATITSIAPTGTIGLIADCSYSIEPLFSIVTIRNVEESMGKKLYEINPSIKRLTGLNDPIDNQCIIIPKHIRDIAITANEISPEWHIKMQAIFQKYTDNSISKTVNLPNTATIEDVKNIYLLAHKEGCKGITIYRDNSREKQLLTKVNCVECATT
jgi:ribonucleoside-diphosphate reductase alpha chain